jgi:hypothetical protein
MRWIAVAVVSLALAAGASATGSLRVVSAHGVRVRVPAGWHRLGPTPSSIDDPRTLLVVGTVGVRWNLKSVCQIASYRVPATGAVVVIVGWKSATSGGGAGTSTGRAPLEKLVRVSRPSFECYAGRGAAAGLTLGRKAYQVNVMVGDRASKAQVIEALASARSFDLSR